MTRSATAAFVAALLLTAAPPATAATEPDLAAVERFVAEQADAAAYPGVAVAITRGDRVVRTFGHGTTSAGVEVTARTRMPIASVSKSFTALAAVQLAERGELDLDAPITRHVPEFHLADPRGSAITTRHLLGQTSGITDRTLPEKSLPQPASLDAVVDRVNPTSLASDPGARYHYTNTNFHLAALVVQRVTGEQFADYLRDNVFAPLDMRDTTAITTTDELPDDVADGHLFAYGASIPATEPSRFVAGSDGIVSTAEDMGKWLAAQSGAAQSGAAQSGDAWLVAPETLAAMRVPAFPGSTYGLGWQTGDGRARHSGIWFTHCAGQLLLDSGHGVVVLANSGVALGNEGTGALEDGIAAILEGHDAQPSSPRSPVELALGAVTVLSLVLGVLALRRPWRPRTTWQVVARLAPRLVPAVFLLLAPTLLGLLVGGGRDITAFQLALYSPALVLWLALSAVLNLAVLTTRLVRLARPVTG
ncbi:beta-lactamase family protein [Actinosynnema pretiosum subsp. pretiosum]|uniref:Beta-lactamase family protein n=1 Tax=Actinosynnema pretiosum subsp. pretiosum TaxID=103721 RepID=A0AA45L829_9PSEU|nr:Beta-lactamase [Actinosynnema pretiosum subsp. pretiosum]QUF04895.1 beta-lactamase family protein [Actinosynnema pretiosum subsp. pretiosum]